MTPHPGPFADGGLVHEFASLAAVGALVAAILLYRHETLAWQVVAIGTLSLPAYGLALARREWRLLAGVLGLAAATAVSWSVHVVTATPTWELSRAAALTVVAIWAPWRLTERPARAALWFVAIAPVAVLLLGGPPGDLRWMTELVTPRRLGAAVGVNELGIIATVAVVATLALRIQHDTRTRFVLQVVVLIIAGDAGTRAAAPAVLASAILWWARRRSRSAWRGNVLEALPWIAYAGFGAVPVVLRTASRLDDGLNSLTSGRWEIWQEYWQVFLRQPWSGFGLGHTDVLKHEVLDTVHAPHNVPLELGVELGVPGAVVALAGLTLVILERIRRIRGPERWLLRVPLVVFLPTLAALDLPLKRAELLVPIVILSVAVARLSDDRPAPDVSPSSAEPELSHRR